MTVTFIAITDVQNELNAAFDGVQTYTVYGLTIVTASMQAHVDYANNYMNGLLPNLSSSDWRYPIAKLAAVHMACLHALVISSGGSLVGAFDYFLGDLRVTRASPYGAALLRTIAELKEDVLKLMTNLSTPVMTGDVQWGAQTPTDRGALASP